jgi:hypothetical protein
MIGFMILALIVCVLAVPVLAHEIKGLSQEKQLQRQARAISFRPRNLTEWSD